MNEFSSREKLLALILPVVAAILVGYIFVLPKVTNVWHAHKNAQTEISQIDDRLKQGVQVDSAEQERVHSAIPDRHDDNALRKQVEAVAADQGFLITSFEGPGPAQKESRLAHVKRYPYSLDMVGPEDNADEMLALWLGRLGESRIPPTVTVDKPGPLSDLESYKISSVSGGQVQISLQISAFAHN